MKYRSLKLATISAAAIVLATPLFSQEMVKPVYSPVVWQNNETLVMASMSAGKRVFAEYNVKIGEVKALNEMPQAAKKASVSLRNGDIFYTPISGPEKQLTKTPESEKNPVLSPDGKMVAYTRQNDLYTINIDDLNETRYTADGSNVILNGRSSWVYNEEIFGRPTDYCAFWWSPDSKKLAFFRFDDSQVPMFPIFNFLGKHGSVTEWRYPKAGDKNPDVRLGFADCTTGKVVWADFNEKEDQYIGTPYWHHNSKSLIVQWMDRDQSNYRIFMTNPEDGSKKEIYKEYQKSWVDWLDEVKFGVNGIYMVRDFELWEQIYYLPYNGDGLKRLTDGKNWGIKLFFLDENEGRLNFTARREISTRNDIYSLKWGKDFKKPMVSRLSEGEFNYATSLFSPDGKYIATVRSNISTPSQLVLVNANAKKDRLKILSDSKAEQFDKSKLAIPEMVFIQTPDGYTIPATVIWPFNMDKSKKYPVLVNMYGGPNSGSVMDTWRTPSPTAQMWAQEGVIQLNIDHRASGHCGKEGMNFIHRSLGKVEIADYILWIKHFIQMPFVDSKKVGITGFSYGGTMTLLALTEGADYFQYGIAGGGVYDWLLYDSHYTERYMDHPADNPEGYKEASVLNKVAKYTPEKGSLLRITHGSSDDNVHMQNTMQLIEELQKIGKHFELMIYPGGMHGYRGAQGKHSNDEDIRFWKKVLLNK